MGGGLRGLEQGDVGSGKGRDAFFSAASAEEVTACLAAGADLNMRDRFGLTPLHRAARYNLAMKMLNQVFFGLNPTVAPAS